MAKKKDKNNKTYKRFVLLVFLFTLVAFALLIYKIYKMDVLTQDVFIIASSVIGAVLLLVFLFAHFSKKILSRFISLLLLIGLTAVPFYLLYNINLTESLINNASMTIVKEEVYNVYVLKDSSLKKMSDLSGKSVGVFNNKSDSLKTAVSNLKKSINGECKELKYYDEIETLLSKGIAKEEDAVFITSTLENILDDQYNSLLSNYRILGTVVVKNIEIIEKSEKDITKDPFVMYISGIDTYGNIGTVSRSDVNILLAINPKTNEILLVNTPRDYYVKLHSKGAYDKLTHAGIYGIDESLHTLEDLYGTKISYYFKVNFSSLIKVIDALGGVEVDSKYAFSYDGYTFKKGINKLNGKSALAFSRYRKGLPEGDISRGENQEAVIKAIIDKVSSPSIITNYSSLLQKIENSFVTNIDTSDIYKLAKYQMENSFSWKVSTSNVRGIDAYDVTFSTGKTKLYVMKQDETSIEEVKENLKRVLEQ